LEKNGVEPQLLKNGVEPQLFSSLRELIRHWPPVSSIAQAKRYPSARSFTDSSWLFRRVMPGGDEKSGDCMTVVASPTVVG